MIEIPAIPTVLFDNIPAFLKEYKNWVVWQYEVRKDSKGNEKLTKVPYQTNQWKAKINDATTWNTFDECRRCIENAPPGVIGLGLVFSPDMGVFGIDFDYTEDQTEIDRQHAIYDAFQSYAERSPSGRGLHILAFGRIPSGRRRGSIEIYGNERFFTMTGDVYRNAPLAECAHEANELWAQMRPASKHDDINAAEFDKPQTMEDAELIKRATNASDGAKFKALYEGDIYTWHGGDHSKADQALINIIAFYTDNIEQVTRIFHASALGQRVKAKRGDYLKRTIDKAFDQKIPPIDTVALKAMIEEKIRAEAIAPVTPTESEFKPRPTTGLLQLVADYIYHASPRPVAEIALAGAIGMLAGICGRAYNIGNTGLNLYVLLLAKTGTGKESMASGISRLFTAVSSKIPDARNYSGPGHFVSSIGLYKALAKNPSFCSIVGEFGINLQLMIDPRNRHLFEIQQLILNAFMKSAHGSYLEASAHADKDKAIKELQSPALSLLAETVPETFYETLNEQMIKSGFLPRFLIIEYKGPRVALNKKQIIKPSFELVDKLSALIAQCNNLNAQNIAQNVALDTEAEILLDEFEVYCTKRINSGNREINNQLWNRAHLKASRLAALAAVCDDPYNPCVTYEQVAWATELVANDCANIEGKFERGEVGDVTSINNQFEAIRKTISGYYNLTKEQRKTYKINEGLFMMRQIPYSYIQNKVAGLTCFLKDKRGKDAIRYALTEMIKRGELVLIEDYKRANVYMESHILS